MERKPKSQYRDHKAGVSHTSLPFITAAVRALSLLQLSSEEYDDKLHNSSTLYIGNMSFFTSEEQVYELFSMCGEVKRIIMGLDRIKKTPCGFCFVEYPNARICVQP